MKRWILLATIVAFAMSVANCQSVDKRDIGGKKITHVTKTGVHFFGIGGAPVTACIDALSAEGAKYVIEAKGNTKDGLPGLTRILTTTGTESCSASGY
ncbi:MAG: hypothetical protein N2Z22_11485 [Turneriella sp.]|nr:hypothetical protein [Turneriella sp.]